jgi:ABC-type lipoprotein export system ATPase subunit
MQLVTTKDIYKTYYLGEVDVPVLKGVSLEIGKGEMVALMGASGSGKTTLMNLLGCLDRPTSGRYWLNGEEVSELSPTKRADVRNRMIGFVFQSFNLLPRTSALENVRMPLDYTHQPITENEAIERGRHLLELVGLGHRMDHHPAQMSGGQQQRVAIARALINNPPLLLADEPTGNLDSTTTEEILQTFQKLNKEKGITIVIVTHEPDVGRHCQRIIRMRDGRIENDERAAIDQSGAVQSALHVPSDAELLRLLAAHGKHMDGVLEHLTVEEKIELRRLLSSWADHLPMPPDGDALSSPVIPSG